MSNAQSPLRPVWRRHRISPKGAFTRVELLVVVSILALLAASLLLVLRKGSKPHVKPDLCLTNVKQLATAQLLYAADNQERFCPSYLDYTSVELNNVWMGSLAKYHGRPDGVWLCPAATNAPRSSFRGNAEAHWTYQDRMSGTETPGCYAVNAHLGLGANYKRAKDSSFKVQNVFHRESAVSQPAQTPVFTDAIYWNCGLEETDAPSHDLYEPEGNFVPGGLKKILTQIIARHGDLPAALAPRNVTSGELPGAINIAFVDGHAEVVPLEKLWTLYWHKNWDPNKVPSPHPAPK